jgi:hypothetical protein
MGIPLVSNRPTLPAANLDRAPHLSLTTDPQFELLGPTTRVEQTRVVEGVSQTAIFAAQVRAVHAILNDDPIFEDPYALALSDASEEEIRAIFDLILSACARGGSCAPEPAGPIC